MRQEQASEMGLRGDKEEDEDEERKEKEMTKAFDDGEWQPM